jgi:hypothetical protein
VSNPESPSFHLPEAGPERAPVAVKNHTPNTPFIECVWKHDAGNHPAAAFGLLTDGLETPRINGLADRCPMALGWAVWEDCGVDINKGLQSCQLVMEREMDASLETIVIAGYVFAIRHVAVDSSTWPAGANQRPGTDRARGGAGDHWPQQGRQFLGAVGKLLPGLFPHDQTQYNRRLRHLTPWIRAVQLMVAQLLAEAEVRLVDGTLISCANYPKRLYVWDMRLS